LKHSTSGPEFANNLIGEQGAIFGIPTDLPVYGLGQTSGNLESLVPAGSVVEGQPIGVVYGDSLLLATGTFGPVLPNLDVGPELDTISFL
jgi:hypothetical protein